LPGAVKEVTQQVNPVVVAICRFSRVRPTVTVSIGPSEVIRRRIKQSAALSGAHRIRTSATVDGSGLSV